MYYMYCIGLVVIQCELNRGNHARVGLLREICFNLQRFRKDYHATFNTTPRKMIFLNEMGGQFQVEMIILSYFKSTFTFFSKRIDRYA